MTGKYDLIHPLSPCPHPRPNPLNPQLLKLISYINLNSCDIAELGTMSIDYEWRENLKKGDLLDVCDTTHVWYNSTVLDRKKRVGERGDEIIEVKIGYRVYDTTGTSVDENG